MKTWICTQDGCLVNLNYITLVKPFGHNCTSIVGWSTNPKLQLNSSYDGMITFGVYDTEQIAAQVLSQFQSWLNDGDGGVFSFPSSHLMKDKLQDESHYNFGNCTLGVDDN